MRMKGTGITLGKTYRDPVSGFIGIATSVTYWLHGCARVELETGGIDKDTGAIKPVSVYFDSDRVKNHEVKGAPDLTGEAVMTKSAPITGGAMDSFDPGRSVDPRR